MQIYERTNEQTLDRLTNIFLQTRASNCNGGQLKEESSNLYTIQICLYGKDGKGWSKTEGRITAQSQLGAYLQVSSRSDLTNDLNHNNM